MNKDRNPWTVLSDKKVYDNNWISLHHFEVLNPNGGQGIYGKVHFKNYAIGIVVLDEHRNTWLIGQYRFALGEYTWEIPEGGCPEGTAPLDSARRELLEEAGIEARDWKLILQLQLSNSVTDEIAFIFLAQDIIFHRPEPEETEQLSIRKLPFSQAFEMVESGEIKDAISVAAIYKVHSLLK